MKVASAIGILLFVVFGLFTYSFYAGSILVVKGFDNPIKITTRKEPLDIKVVDESVGLLLD